MSNNQDLHNRRNAALSKGMSTMLPVYVERGQNAELWDADGRRYIEFAGGIAVLNSGHMHPHVKQAVIKQLDAGFTHTCLMITPYRVAVELAEKLNALVPGPTPKKTMLVTTGAEAVENAVKIARAHTGRHGVVAFGGGVRVAKVTASSGREDLDKLALDAAKKAPLPAPPPDVATDDLFYDVEYDFK